MFPKIIHEIKTKADTDSPELTGVPTAPTPSDDINTNQIANIEYVISKSGQGIPETLPNPEALTINTGSTSTVYDGSSAKSVNIEQYTHPDSGVVAGKYNTVTVNAQGHVTHGENISSFPDQTNQQNKPLITDGNNPQWSDIIDIKTINSNSDVVKINTDGNYLYTWGTNSDGQVGDGTTIYANYPYQIPSTKWKCVNDRLSNVTLAIDDTGNLYGWGCNYYGYLSDLSTKSSQLTPRKLNNSKWKTIIHHDSKQVIHALDENGYLYGWGGFNSWDLIGNGETTGTQYTPFKIPITKWKSVIGTTAGTFAIDENDYLFVWGCNINNTLIGNNLPYKISNITKWKYVYNRGATSTGTTTCAIDIDDYLYVWGRQAYGELGNGSQNSSQVTLYKISDTTKWKCVDMSSDRESFAITKDGYLYGWGYSMYKTIPNASTNYQLTPLKISETKWKYICAGADMVFAIDETDYLYGWGNNSNGKVGNGTTNSQNTPFKISDTKWKYAVNSAGYSFGITNDGYLYGWGCNRNGIICNGNTTAQLTPYLVTTVTKWKFIYVDGTVPSINAIDENNYLYQWTDQNILRKLPNVDHINIGKFTTPRAAITINNKLLISNETNQLTFNDKKVLVEGDINLPITIDENGDYVLG